MATISTAAAAAPPKHSRAFGLFLIVGLSLAWGCNWAAMKVALAEIQPWSYRTLTSYIAAPILLGLAAMNGGRVRLYAREIVPIAICGLFNITAWHMFTAYALLAMGAGHVALLAHTMPVWAALIAVFLGERLTPRIILATALGLAGIMALYWRHLASLGGAPFAPLLGLGAALFWAIGMIFQKRRDISLPTLSFAGWQLAIAALPVAAMAFLWEGFTIPPVPLSLGLIIAYTILVSHVFSYFAWFKIVEIFPTQIAAIATLMTPVVGVVSGAVLLGEHFGLAELTATLLCGSALALVLIVPARKRA